MRKFTLIAILTLLSNWVLASLPVDRFDRIKLNQNTISSLHQDKSGFIWMGTPNGLFRYDGNEYKSFIHHPGEENSLINSNITDIFEDKDEQLWIVTKRGISLYNLNKREFTTFSLLNDFLFKNELVKKVVAVSDKEVYVLTDIRLLKVSKNENATYSIELTLKTTSDKSYKDFYINKDNYYLLSNGKFEVFKSDINTGQFKLQEFIQPSEVNVSAFFAIHISKEEQKLYLATNKSILTYDLNWAKLKKVEGIELPLLSNDNKQYVVNKLVMEDEKDLWMLTSGCGIIQYNTTTKKIKQFKHSQFEPTSVSSNIINDLLVDNSGVYWFATGHGGISVLDSHKKPFYHISHHLMRKNSLSSDLVNSIYVDKENKLWVGTFENGLNISDDEFQLANAQRMTFKHVLKDARIYTDVKELGEYLYLGTSRGLMRYDHRSRQFELVYKEWKDSPHFHVQTMERLNDDIYFYAHNNIYVMKGKEGNKIISLKEQIKNYDLLNNKQVFVMYNDGEDGIFLGTEIGLYHYKAGSDSIVVSDDYNDNIHSTSESIIFTMHKSDNGDLWVGTFGEGLLRCQTKDGKIISHERYTKKNGLPDNVIYSIVEAKDQNLWLSTDNGIVGFNPKNGEMQKYDVSDGLLSNNFRKSSHFMLEDGTILMGGLKGITAYNPLEISSDPVSPRPQILNFKVRNEEIQPLKEYEDRIILKKPIYKTDEIVLPYDFNQITIDFGVIQYKDKNSIKFSYRLLGVDDRWVKANKLQRSANYAKLPSGEYVFELKAFNTDGLESNKIKRLKIIIEKPWYSTYWAYSVYFLLVCLVIFGTVRYLRFLFKLKQTVLAEKKDKQHLREINEAKLKFFTNISHELRTPLTLILSPLEKLSYDKRLHPDLKSFVENINTNGQRLLNLTNSLIDFRKIGEGDMKIRAVFHNASPFIFKTVEAFSDYAKDKNITYTIEVAQPEINGWIDKGVIERILFNLLSNAFKYTHKNGEVNFVAYEENTMLYFEVTDSGIGMDREEMQQIFDRFYRANNEETLFSSSGIGLNLVQQLLHLHHGKISVESEKGFGSKFRVEIPLLHPEFNKTTKESEQPAKADSKTKKTVHSSDKSQILIVDDNVEILKLIRELFQEDYEVSTAENGLEGLEQTEKVNFDIIILDVDMPKMNGYELAEKLKENIQTSHIPIIFLTAMSDLDSRKKALEKGGQLHIGKPFSPYLLELQVKNLINQKNQEKALLKKNIIMSPDKDEVLTKDEMFMQDIKKILEKNYQEDTFTVEELAEKMNMSYMQFYRKFKQLVGTNANEYLREYRLEKASHLLASDESLTVREVMFTVGLSSQSYFTKAFKKKYGATPAEYKKLKKAEMAKK